MKIPQPTRTLRDPANARPSFAYAELYLVLATVFRRFELKLFETTREKDIAYTRDCFIGKASVESKGVRMRILRGLD